MYILIAIPLRPGLLYESIHNTLSRRMRSSYHHLHAALHAWYQQHGRLDLPWRHTRDPYPIYLSEIMLQQTQVKTVLERYYFPFLARFPTLQSVADAPLSEVLYAWQGLGYYSRARYLHHTAQQTGGQLPRSIEALQLLPGIGKNTAHAIASFAFHAPHPVMEANVKRVIARLFALENPSDKELWDYAHALLDRNNVFDYNQAMMDMGAMICTKTAPSCAKCPFTVHCQGKANPAAYPMPIKRKAVPTRHYYVYLLVHDNQVAIAARATRFLQGLHMFLESPSPLSFEKSESLGEFSQTYSHFHKTASVYRVLDASLPPGYHWALWTALENYPFSQFERQIIESFQKRL